MKIRRIFDLSHSITEGMPILPGHPTPEITQVSSRKDDEFTLSRITVGSHTGTHADAPSHRIEGGATIDEIPLEKLVGEAVVLDLTHIDLSEAIRPSDLQQQEQEVKEGDIVLICTGIGRKWGDVEFITKYPYFSAETAEWFVERSVKAVGVDWMSIDKHERSRHPAHDILLSHNIPVIENLANLDLVKGMRIFFICLPLKLKGGDGSPARALAIEFDLR